MQPDFVGEVGCDLPADRRCHAGVEVEIDFLLEAPFEPVGVSAVLCGQSFGGEVAAL